MKERDFTIDIMRSLGILLIILAHMNPTPSDPLFQIRTFDVPMMVFISGAAFFLAGKTSVNYFSYVWSRIKRLVFPVWVFLAFFYLITFLFNIEITRWTLNYNTITTSFKLESGFGYVWIIKVFLIVALLSPLYVLMVKKIGELKTIFLFTLMCVVITFVYFNHSEKTNGLVNFILDDNFIYSVSYGLMFVIGYLTASLSKKNLSIVFALHIVLLVIFCVFYFNSFRINDYKNPPTIVYISYAVFMSITIYSILKHLNLKNKIFIFIINQIAPNTIWIYLWHIPMIFFTKNYFSSYHYILSLVITSVFSIVMAVYQRKFVNWLTLKIKKQWLSKFINQVFTG